MKKMILFLLMLCLLLCIAGCSVTEGILSALAPTEEIFFIDSYHLQITADSTFQKKTGGDFDLQITNGKSYISIMAYQYTDLPEGVAPRDVFDMQNEDLFHKRDHVSTIEEPQTQSLSERSIIQAMYSAEKDGVKNYYRTYLIDIPARETFAWILITAKPSYLSGNIDYLNNIVCSLTAIDETVRIPA